MDIDSLLIERYTVADEADWDKFVENSWNGTFLHQRKFLSYHQDRFMDYSLLIRSRKNGRVLALLPAALNPLDLNCVISHPGITYGGLLVGGDIYGSLLISVFEKVFDILRNDGIRRFVYKPVPYIYHRIPMCDDVYALYRLNALKNRCDLSSTIDFFKRGEIYPNRLNELRTSQKKQLRISEGNEFLRDYWAIVEQVLFLKHNKKPVHSYEEIFLLAERFPNNIKCVVAFYQNKIIAGTVLFITTQVVHTQYLVADFDFGRRFHALDLVIEYVFNKYQNTQRRYLDFGISTENDGYFLNDGLYWFKRSFGSGSVVYESYQVDL